MTKATPSIVLVWFVHVLVILFGVPLVGYSLTPRTYTNPGFGSFAYGIQWAAVGIFSAIGYSGLLMASETRFRKPLFQFILATIVFVAAIGVGLLFVYTQTPGATGIE